MKPPPPATPAPTAPTAPTAGPRCTLRHCLLYVLAVTVPLLLLGAWGKSAYEGARQERLARDALQSVEAARAALAAKLHEQVSLVSLLAWSSQAKAYLAQPSQSTRVAVEERFVGIAEVLGEFDQLRLLDLSGREVVRVDHRQGRTTVTPEASLQDKSGHDYVVQGLKLEAGALFVSQLDLNVEHGRVEDPAVPMLRMVAPVMDAQGQRLGLLVANYRAQLMLDGYQRIVETVAGYRGMLLNSDGYWLINHNSENEWGWMRGRPERTAAQQLPALWQRMQSAPTGVFEAEHSLYVFSRMSPFAQPGKEDIGAPEAKRLRVSYTSAGSRQWYALIEIPKTVLQSGSFFHTALGQAFMALYLVISVGLAWVLAQMQGQRQALRAAAARELTLFRDLYDRAPFGYCSLDHDGVIRRINQTLLTWLARDREAVVGRLRLQDVLASEAHPRLAQLLETSLATGEPVRLEAPLQVQEGVMLPVQLAIHPLQDQSQGHDDLRVRVAMEDVSVQHELRQTLDHMASSDPLTGLKNRRGWQEAMAQEVRRARRLGQPLAFMMLDIDHFKRINDSYGHDVGDMALQALAQTMGQCLRDVDVVARLGGEEFVVLAADTDSARALELAQRLRNQIGAIAVPLDGHGHGQGAVLRFTVSIGLACARGDAIDPEALLKQADAQLYVAKQSGRNRVCVAPTLSAPGL